MMKRPAIWLGWMLLSALGGCNTFDEPSQGDSSNFGPVPLPPASVGIAGAAGRPVSTAVPTTPPPTRSTGAAGLSGGWRPIPNAGAPAPIDAVAGTDAGADDAGSH